MIYFTWSVMPTAGKEEQATKWLVELAKHANQAHHFGHVELARSLDGAGWLHWVFKVPSLAVFEQALAVWRADKHVDAANVEGRGLVGQAQQHFYETVEG
jgi:hypothetical protein